MQVDIQMVITQGDQKTTHDVLCFEREELSIETLGLTLKESKAMTAEIQKKMIEAQVKDYLSNHMDCTQCGKLRLIKSYHNITCRTLFGKIHLKCPRLFECLCENKQALSLSPLTKALVSRSTPDLIYMESKWASLMSYGVTAAMLEDVFPIKVSSSSVYNTAMKVATRLEQELPAERHMYIEGSQRTWNELPRPGLPLTVGIDGGYVHAREGNNRKAGWFEVIVGKSLQEEHASKRFGYVSTYDTKSKRRLHEMLKEQGLQMNQEITFLTDGGDTVRDLPFYLSPRSEHILDWFHITMKITIIKQIAKGILGTKYQKFQDEIDSIKWYLWHGNAFRALDLLETLSDELYTSPEDQKNKKNNSKDKLWKLVDEFGTYIQNNQEFIINYGERYRYGETISTSFAESTVDELVSRRMVKKQHMRWTKKGAHLLLQLRVKTLNQDLRKSFVRWYPKMEQENESIPLAA
jgi:hypothetical protein